jgi:glycosyltransferase involved in cell wall biosynthesis
MSQRAFVRVDGGQDPGDCRILYVVGQLHTGGLERQLYYLLRSIDRDRYRPAVAIWHYEESDLHVQPIRSLGVPLYAIANESSRAAKLAAFRRLVKGLAPEVIHSYSFHTNVAASWAAYGTAAVPVGSLRSDFNWAKQGTGILLGRLCARWPAFHVANSASAAASAQTSPSFFAPRRCEAVTNGLDLEMFRTSDVPVQQTVRIVGLGYLLAVKRWDRVLRAARVLKQRNLDCTIDIIGGGPLKDALQRQAQELDVADRVRFENHTDDVPAVLAASSFTVLTSDTEGYPNAVMEAMACGRAVVATSVGDLPRLVDDGETGFLVGPGDEPMLVDRMARLITDPMLCRRMGAAAGRKARREFGLDRLVRETLSAYRQAGWKDEGEPGAAGSLAARQAGG